MRTILFPGCLNVQKITIDGKPAQPDILLFMVSSWMMTIFVYAY